MADIQYLNYGDLQIELLALLDMINDEKRVIDYVNSLPWSNKRKRYFMNNYYDIRSRGITGASIKKYIDENGKEKTGWVLSVNGDDPKFEDEKDKEMLGEVAYYFKQQMDKLPTKASQELSKEEEKKNLPLFDNAYFTKELGNYISTKEFGGRPIDTQTDWNSLDKRDPNTGLRGRTERAATLARNLKLYADSLDESKLNFEGSPFENLNDFKTRVNRAIEALNTPDESDDTQALNAIGLRASDWFNDGSGDPVTVTLDDGTLQTTTYGQLAEYNKKIEEDKLKKEQEQKLALQELIKQKYAQKIANSYDGAMRSSSSLIGTDIKKLASKYTNDQNLKKQLSDYSKSLNLDRSLWEEIVGAFLFYNSKGALLNLSRDELNKFERLVGYRGLAPSVLKKLPGVDGFYFDTRTNQVIRPYKKDQQDLLSSLDLLELYNPNNRKLSEGFETEDWIRMGAMSLDIAGTIAAFLPGYGTIASAGLGVTSLLTNLAADLFDESLSFWDKVKNVGMNAALAGVGLIPGLGLTAKGGKWLTQIAKWVPRLLTMEAIRETASPEVLESLSKAADSSKWSEITNDDWKNIGFALATAAATARGARGIVDNRKYKPAFKEPTKTETFITTKSGNKIPATKEQVNKINEAGRKGGNEKANEELRKLSGAKADDEVNIEFKTGLKGTLTRGNKVELESSTTSASASPRVQAYQRALERQNNYRKSGRGVYKFAPRFLPTSYDIYKGAASLSIPQSNILDRIKKIWNPVGESKSKKSTGETPKTNSTEIPKVSETKSTETSKINRQRMNELKEKFGRNKTESSNPKQEYNLKQQYKSEKEIELFEKSYGTNNSSSKNSFGEGYGSNNNTIKNGELNVDLGNGIKFSFKVNNAAEYKGNPGKVSALRGLVAKKIKEQLYNKNVDHMKVGNLLRNLKRYGWLKQGGTIDKQKIQKYKEFIKK